MNDGKLAFADTLAFILAGDARFTIVSLRTGTRYTFRVRKGEPNDRYPEPAWFVSLLTGPDNESDYQYFGLLKNGDFRLSPRSKMDNSSGPVAAMRWLLAHLIRGVEPKNTEVWHTGRCGKCGRALTVPASVASGYGPECAAKLGIAA